MTRDEFSQEMEWFLKFYDANLNSVQSNIWFETFRYYSQSDFSKALRKHTKEDTFTTLPAPGKISIRLSECSQSSNSGDYDYKKIFTPENERATPEDVKKLKDELNKLFKNSPM